MVHYRKAFSTYMFFASSLIWQCPQLQAIRAFGTDGVKALIYAFSHEFGFSQHLTCFIHVRRNIKDQLDKCSVPTTSIARVVIDDIFEWRLGSTFDLVDSNDFQEKLDCLLRKWQDQNWSKVHVIRDTMIRPVREDCGLGAPPDLVKALMPYLSTSTALIAIIDILLHFQAVWCTFSTQVVTGLLVVVALWIACQ